MTRKPSAQACANLAMDELDGDFIPYILGKETLDGDGADCQGLIEAIVRALGGRLSYRGSNDMFRNACSYVGTLSQARKDGRLVPGAVLFIVRQDGGEPPQYKDKKGNASHVGWYTGGRYEVVHASSSRGKVAASTLKNAWTHVGWLKALDYSNRNNNTTIKEEPMSNQGPILSQGDHGEAVATLQSGLLSLGYDLGKHGADGIFGPATRNAVERFQDDQGFPLTGQWGEEEQAALQQRLALQAGSSQTTDLSDRLRALAQELLALADAI